MYPLDVLATLLCPTTLIITVGYALRCVASPFGPCRRCARRPGRRRVCRACQGTGRRIRIGRHLWNEYRRVHREGTR